jgi:hypothetical protein
MPWYIVFLLSMTSWLGLATLLTPLLSRILTLTARPVVD